LISPEEGDQSRDQEGPRDQRVEQEADEEHGANLTEALDRDQHHGREGDGEVCPATVIARSALAPAPRIAASAGRPPQHSRFD
jgi:hypothetical protein